MATEANLEPISEKNLQVTEQSQTEWDSLPTDSRSSLHDTAKGDTLHSTADSILDTSEGEILVEAPSNDQGSLINTVAQNEKVNGQKLDTRIKEHIIEEDSIAMNVLERGASDVNVVATEKQLSTDETDDDHLEISTTESENIINETVDLGEVMETESSKELKLADAISCNPATLLSTVEESLQSDKMLTVDPISVYGSMSDVHLLSTSKDTENNVTLIEEKTTFENSEATQELHFEDGEVEVDGKMLKKMNSPGQNINEVNDKGENLNDELQTVLIPITSTECTSNKDGCKDENLEEAFDLRTDNKNPVDVKAKDEEIDKGTSDASSSIQLIAEETEKLEVVSTAHDEGQSSEEVLDHDEDDTLLTSLSMPNMSKVDPEDYLEEAEALSGTQNEKIESVIEDKDINTMDESTSSNAESNIRTEGVSMTEPSDKEKSQELPEVKIEEDSAPTEDGQECRIENPLLDAGPEEIAKPEKENTCKEDLSTTVEENSEENGGKCEKIADSLANKYQDLGEKIVNPNYKTQQSFVDLPFAQDRAEETIQEGGEMRATAITSSNDDLKHDAGDNLDQKSQGPETENVEKNSKLLSEDPNHRTVDAEATNIDTSGNALEVHAAVTAPFVSQATTVEDIEKTMEHGERTEEEAKPVDNNEDHDKHTCEAIVEVVAANRDHEDSRNVEDSNPEDEQNDENTGVIYMEQMEDKNLCKGNELEQEKNDLELSEDSNISLEKSKTEETLDYTLEKDKLEDVTEYDPSPGCEKLIKEKHIVFLGDIEKDQLEKQEQENYNAHDKHEIVKEKNEDLQETICEKDEQDTNYAGEKEILETAYIQDKILVDRGGHGSENTEMVSESGPENKIIEQTDETEATRIDKSTFDDNFSNMNIATNDLFEETTTENEMSERSKANNFVDEETMQEKVHENSTDTVCEEKNHNMINDKDLIREEIETENSEKVSQLVSEENSHNKISALEAVDIDTLAGGSDLATSQVQEESTQKSTDPEVANEHISSINNDDEGHNTNEELTKVAAENDIQETTEEKRCMEDMLMSIDEDKIESEKLEKRDNLDEGKESVTLSDDVEICLDETTTENTSGSSVEIIGSEDKLEKSSDASEKNIKVEISASSQDVEEMDLLEEQEESFKEKDEAGMPLEDAVPAIVTDKASSILDAAHTEYINEVEETYGTINNNSIERDPSQKSEFISAPALEDKDPEINEEKETSKTENSIDDDDLKRKNIATNDLLEETTTANEMSERSKANDFVDEETMQEKVHENSTDTVCEGKNHNMINDKDLNREEIENENSEEVSQLVSEENSHNKISSLEDVDIDTLAGGSDLAISQVQEERTQKSTDPEVANEHISSINNDDEGHNTNEGLTKVVVENDIQERTEEKRCMEGELTIGMSIDEDKIESEKLEKRNDLDEGKESATVSDNVEICLDETTTENTSGSRVEIIGSEDKPEKSSDASEKNIKVEISASSQDVEEMDLVEEQEESFKEKDEAGMLLEDAVPVMVTDKASSILDAAHMEYINEVEDDKQKESLESTSVEERDGTINNNSIERDPSQKIEFISAPALEDKDPETNEEKETSKIENSIDEDDLKRKISETIEPNDLIESAKDELTETKDTDSNSNSYVLIEEQTCQSTNLIRNTACVEKIDNKKFGISSGLLDDKDQEEIGESAIAKIDSSIDDINSKMINRIAELSEDIEIVQMKDEENFINAIKESPDDHALVVPTPSKPTDEKYEEASKYELEEQCHQINNAEDKTEADIHKGTENLQPDKMEIPEIVDHNDDPETAKVRSKDTLERSIQNTGVLVEKANNNGIGEEQENACHIIDSEDTVDVDVHKEKGNTTMLDIDSDMGQEQGQVAISEKDSVKVEQRQSLQNDAQCSIIKEMTNDTAPGSSVEHNIKETACEFGSDEKLETTSRSENINDEVHQDVQEEPLNKIHEKSVSSKNENLAKVESEREMIAGEAKDANLVRIAYEETKELEEEIPATTFTGQNSERKVVDGTKRGTTTEEVEESKTTTVAQNSETLVEMKSDKIQLPGDASQTMEAKGQGDKTYTTIREDDSNILNPIIVEKDTKNQDENTNEILDPLPITSAMTDGAAYGSLHSDQDGSTIKADHHSIDDIPNQEVDSELRSVGQNVEVTIETEPIRLDIPENDGMEGDELSMASEDKLERLEFERREMTRMKEEALDVCPSQVKEPTEDAEVVHIPLQTIENEGVAVTEAEVKSSDLMSQENLENGLSTTEASLEENMPESASTVLSEGQSQNVPTHINVAEKIILEDETEKVQLLVQESLNDEVQNEKQEEKSEVKADQIESQMNTNDTNEKERQSSKVASHKAKLEEGELEKTLYEVPKEIETTETENIYKDRIEKQNLDEDMQMYGNELLKDSITELEGGNNEPIHDSDATEDAIPQEEYEESKCKIVDDLPVVSHKLVEEPNKMETSDHQQMKNTEPEIIEKGGETSDSTITQNNEILQTSEKSYADVENDANEHVQQLEGLSSTISNNLEIAETMEYIEKNSDAEEEAFRAQIIASLREATANEQFQGEENDSNKQNKPETNWKSEITITAPNDEVEISEDKPESEKALNANEIDIEIPKEKTTSIECKMVDDLPVVNHQLVEEPRKMETSSDHQQMKHPEPEILEKGDETSEGTITENNEILETSSKSDAHIQNDANEHVQLEGLSSTISNNLGIAVSKEYLEKKNNEAEEEAFRAQMIASLREVTANEQFQEEENDSNKQKEPETNWKSDINITVPSNEVEISEDKPESEEALNANELDIEIPKEKISSTECPTEVEKLVCSIGYPASVPGVHVNSEEIPDAVPSVISVTKSSEKNKIDKEDVKNRTEVSISRSREEEEDRKDISSVEVTESKESTHKMSTMLEPELCQPEEKREMEQVEEEASYGVECDASQDEQTQQIDHHDLPVSQLLMDHILREEVLHTACNVEAEDDNHEGTDGVKQHDAGVLKGACNVSPKEFQNTSENVESQDKIQEKNDDGDENGTKIQNKEILASLMSEQTACTTENKVGQENESSSPLVEEKKTSDANEKIEIPAVKDDEETYSNLQDSSLIMAVAEDVKDEIPKMSEESIPAKDIKDEMPSCSMSEESTPVLVNDSREPTIKEKEETHINLQDSSPIMTVAEDIKDEIPRMSEESTFIPSMSKEPTPVLVNDSREPTIKDDEETHSNLQDSSPIMAVAEDIKDEIPRMLEESTLTEDVKDEIPSTSEESSPVLINDSSEPTVKDDEETHSNLQDSSPMMAVAEDVKDEIPIMSEESTPVLVNDSREPTSTEERSTETKTGIEECMDPTLVQDEKAQGNILEMCAVEQEINRSVESLSKDVNLSSVAKTYAEDDLLEEGKVIPQDVEKSDEASYAVMEGHYHSNAESIAGKKNLVHKEETLPDHRYDQYGRLSESSHLQDDLLGQTLEIDPKVKKIEIEDKDGDDFTEIQAQQDKDGDDFTEIQAQPRFHREITYLSGPEEVEQSNFAVKSKDEILEVTENLLEDRSLSSDEKEAVETKEMQVYEDKLEAEKEHKAEESVQDERIIGEARDAELKPAHKKSHNILSGVGSKVKHSLAKVKKAITGKSSHSKATPAN